MTLRDAAAWIFGGGVFLIGLGFGSSSCSLKPPSSFSWVRMTVEGAAAYSKNQSFLIAPGRVGFWEAVYSPSPPAAVDGFQCLALNVMGEDIASRGNSRNRMSYPVLLGGSPCGYPAATSAFVNANAGGTLEVLVPSGRQRIIQVLGFQSQIGCPSEIPRVELFSASEQTPSFDSSISVPFEVGRKVLDLFSNVTVEIFNAYDARTPRQLGTWECSPSPSPSPSVSVSVSPSPSPSPIEFVDSTDTASGFLSGTKTNLVWSAATNRMELDAGWTSGDFLSRVFDAGAAASWEKIEWIPGDPYKKGLPDGKMGESGYPLGLDSATMGTNLLLIHFDASMGGNLVVDYLDKSGNTNIGANTCGAANCPALEATGLFGGAAIFESNSNTGPYYKISGPPLSLSTGADYSISVWIKPLTANVTGGVFEHAYSTADTDYLLLLEKGSPKFNTQTEGGQVYLGTADTCGAASTWCHLGVIRRAGTVYLYMNGVEKDNRAVTSAYNTTEGSYTFIGNSSWAFGNDIRFDGQIDELAVWGSALTVSQMQALYRRGITELKFQVRSCDQPSCSGATFVGPDGTSGSYFTEKDTASITTPLVNLSGHTSKRYFQYVVYFNSSNSAHTPFLYSVKVKGSVPP